MLRYSVRWEALWVTILTHGGILIWPAASFLHEINKILEYQTLQINISGIKRADSWNTPVKYDNRCVGLLCGFTCSGWLRFNSSLQWRTHPYGRVGGSLRQPWRTPHQPLVAENHNTHRNSPSDTAERHHNEICGSFVSTVW